MSTAALQIDQVRSLSPNTHPIGPVTCNLSVNVKLHIRAALGRLASVLGISMGRLVRVMIKKAADVWVSEIWAGHAAALDRRAVEKLDRAGAPDSDGGEAYTKAEIAEIRVLLEKSARLDERIADRLELREANT